uniref:Uncharacterized protein n=1 Tax=Timema tahoe TaxID=61484 RepID=A0A7R9NUR9_9NEOP|nr:unnamed protein product [Timema tahoe]
MLTLAMRRAEEVPDEGGSNSHQPPPAVNPEEYVDILQVQQILLEGTNRRTRATPAAGSFPPDQRGRMILEGYPHPHHPPPYYYSNYAQHQQAQAPSVEELFALWFGSTVPGSEDRLAMCQEDNLDVWPEGSLAMCQEDNLDVCPEDRLAMCQEDSLDVCPEGSLAMCQEDSLDVWPEGSLDGKRLAPGTSDGYRPPIKALLSTTVRPWQPSQRFVPRTPDGQRPLSRAFLATTARP